MAKSRALLTETEREQIAGEHGDDRRYQATSRVRSRIAEELVVDIAVLKEHHTDLYNELREAVCGSDELDTDNLQGNPNNTIDELDASDSDATHTRETAETQPSGQRDESDTQPTEATDDAVTTAMAAVEYPSGNDADDVAHAYAAVREYLKQHGPATKKEIVGAIRADHPLSYDIDAGDGDGGRDRSAWWRKVVKPLLDSDPSVGYRDNYSDYNINE